MNAAAQSSVKPRVALSTQFIEGTMNARKRNLYHQTAHMKDWRSFAQFTGSVRGNNVNIHEDPERNQMFVTTDDTCYTYELFISVDKRRARLLMEVAHGCKLGGTWPHYKEKRKEI